MADVGTRVRIEYFDHNTRFAGVLPRDGFVVRRLSSTKGIDNFLLLRLDEPFEYENQSHEYLVIRSRWQGHEVGESEPTSVFVLLIPDPTLLRREQIEVETLYHVCWGMATTLVDPH